MVCTRPLKLNKHARLLIFLDIFVLVRFLISAKNVQNVFIQPFIYEVKQVFNKKCPFFEAGGSVSAPPTLLQILVFLLLTEEAG